MLYEINLKLPFRAGDASRLILHPEGGSKVPLVSRARRDRGLTGRLVPVRCGCYWPENPSQALPAGTGSALAESR